MVYPIKKIRSEFPILKTKINHKPLIYLDNAASTQKPNVVINYQSQFYQQKYSAVHRGVHTLANLATQEMEEVRMYVASFINASSSDEIIFTKGTTESINLVANTWGHQYLEEGDNIIITEMEHHSNIVPWQMLAKNKNITLRIIPLLPNGTLNLNMLNDLIDNHTKLLSITHVSNVLGTLNPLKDIINNIRTIRSSIIVLVDGAQAIVHEKIDVQLLDCDFYVFSGHKMYGPSGIGILYGKKSILQIMSPWEVGGGMIQKVNLNTDTTFLAPPWRFEAGSPNINGIAGLGAAIRYINNIGLDQIKLYEKNIMQYAVESLQKIKNITIYGPKEDRISVVSFNINKYHAYDIGLFLDQNGIAIRTGHHCAMPVMNYFNVSTMCRISLAIYTNKEEIDQLIHGIMKISHLLKHRVNNN
ncbi:SufS family cysteine desulfurase [Blochmannia endosymbiont of Polyrhachis (Hedomyrma) turneri]|uniref:SufS family cysteine desulfurase n=1 Tax=Blochmannia endosymbiont of Polyrhachis (Hedomyrma) turneri TaxID=1505596 RepID=UPI00061A7E83|nr:SufS family cysteine desulfurase [Blochmannia endosymbiont of Polyrhachis (Hedomyrma) turneri]AKC59931.1 Cysteine desulfurase [Blochmannia endosymbiont of Polyrhachis (Hedomyrma) turneri]